MNLLMNIYELKHMKSYTFTEEELKKKCDSAFAMCMVGMMMAQAAGEEHGRPMLDKIQQSIFACFTKD